MTDVQCMDVDEVSECDNKHDSEQDEISDPMGVSTIGMLNTNINLLTPPKNKSSMVRRPRSSIKRPRSSIKRLSLASLAPISQLSSQKSCSNSPTLSNKSSASNSNIKTRIKRPRLSISRPTRTMNRTNNTKRLSLTSISGPMLESDDYLDALSTKSGESQQTIISKISFVSSPSSNRSSSLTTNSAHLKREHTQNTIHKIKFANAKIHLEIDKLQIEKKYYKGIVESIKNVVIAGNSDANQALTQQLNNILDAES
eukprot:181197_1